MPRVGVAAGGGEGGDRCAQGFGWAGAFEQAVEEAPVEQDGGHVVDGPGTMRTAEARWTAAALR
jgi:hypothetical protein